MKLYMKLLNILDWMAFRNEHILLLKYAGKAEKICFSVSASPPEKKKERGRGRVSA